MPSSGELRLRTLTLALVALGGLWIALVIQRHHHAPVSAFAAGPQPADHHPAPKLFHVDGLSRPVSPTPLVKATPVPVVVKRAALRPGPKALANPAPVRRPAHAPVTRVIPDSSRSYAESPAPPLEPLAIADARVVAVTDSTARIAWRTNVPTQAQTAFGLAGATIWAQPGGDRVVEHVSDLSGLEYGTTYHVFLHAVDEWNRSQSQELTVTTQPMPGRSTAVTAGGHIVVDGRPFFATAVWGQCSDMFGSNIDDGINLFMGDGCQKESELAARLDGRAYSIVDAATPASDGRGVIGWYYPDEWDAFLQNTVARSDIEKSIPAPQPGRISFLTLTNHFYSRATALPQGKGMYPVLFGIPDVIGFDLYPLQVWCRPAFGDVFDAQRELHDVTGGKPTFQWVEVAPMEHRCNLQPELDPTPATVRAETWLSVAGGADAVGYFPNHWSRLIGAEIARTNGELKALAPALLAPTVPAHADSDAVRVSARELNGALYVIAVNTTQSTVQAKISVDGLGGRSAIVYGSGAAVAADDQGLSDTFGPLAARVYVIPPAGW
jgi:hypothetical protein